MQPWLKPLDALIQASVPFGDYCHPQDGGRSREVARDLVMNGVKLAQQAGILMMPPDLSSAQVSAIIDDALGGKKEKGQAKPPASSTLPQAVPNVPASQGVPTAMEKAVAANNAAHSLAVSKAGIKPVGPSPNKLSFGPVGVSGVPKPNKG